MPGATPSQTIGPYWHLLDQPEWADLTRLGAAGERMHLIGTVADGAGEPVTDACVELWQGDPMADERFLGWGRCATDAQGAFRFTTLRPGPTRGPGNGTQAPHLALTLLARGLVRALHTRAYFEGEPLNDSDPVLGMVEAARRATLLAHRAGPDTWRLDLRLQGEGETVFMEV